ncbi:MAG TPA: hypothetical protein PKN56_16975, partial [Leptospiraceae bacterium]|nr:hypothetical protein [Leptospiraceae bacterium]
IELSLSARKNAIVFENQYNPVIVPLIVNVAELLAVFELLDSTSNPRISPLLSFSLPLQERERQRIRDNIKDVIVLFRFIENPFDIV